jgi:hypothetical protein
MIVVQNHYFAAPGERDRVIATRRDADVCRERSGLHPGRTLIRTRGEESAPDVIWQMEYPDIAAWEADMALLAASPEFTVIREMQAKRAPTPKPRTRR